MFPLISRPFKYPWTDCSTDSFHVYRCKSYSYWSLCRDTSCTETSSLPVIKFKFSENTKQVLNHQEHILFPDRRYFFFTFWDIFNFIYRYNISSILLLEGRVPILSMTQVGTPLSMAMGTLSSKRHRLVMSPDAEIRNLLLHQDKRSK